MNDELREKLRALGLSNEQIGKLEVEGAKDEAGLGLLSADEIKIITGCGTVISKQVAAAFVPVPTIDVNSVNAAAGINDVLPPVPSDDDFLKMLKVGGVLKVGRTEVISIMRAAIASSLGLYDLPKLLKRRMEDFATEQDEPVGQSFYDIQKLIGSRAYGDIFTALNITGEYYNEAQRTEILKRIDVRLWPALRGFQEQLHAWVQAWTTGLANPGMMMSVMMMGQSGNGAVMPPGLMAPPPTDGLRDEAEVVINQINSVFAGTGIPTARALAFDANRIKDILSQDDLPAAIGSATRDQMLKSLGVNVGPDYVRLEQNVIRYGLAVMDLPNVTAGNAELSYLAAMQMLGSQIAWDKLGTGSAASASSSTRRRTEEAPTGAGFRGN